MSTTLVTAIYHSDREGELGGRCWFEEYYFASLQNICNFELPIVIYCAEKGYDKIRNYMEYINYHKPNLQYQIIKSELDDFKFKNIIINHRNECISFFKSQVEERRKTNPDEPGFFHARCEILCHRKLFYVQDAINNNFFNTNNFCWIDAGITHWALTPFSKGGVEINNFFDKHHYYPHNKNNIYTPEIGVGLDKIISDNNMFQFKHGNIWYNNHHVKVLTSLLQTEYGLSSTESDLSEQLVGGVIGITPSEMPNLLEFYEKCLRRLCDTHPPESDFFTEEIILCAYYKLRKHFCIRFDDWGHDEENDPCFVDYGPEQNLKRKQESIQFYKVWDIVKKYNN